MFNTSSDNLSKVIKNAGKIALELGGNQVGTEHILYGLTTVKECMSNKILAEYGVTSSSLKEVLCGEEEREKVLAGIDVELTPRSKEILATAKQVALQLNHNFVGTEHLLFALLVNNGTYAVKVLTNSFKINLTEIKSKVLISLQSVNSDDAILDDANRSLLPDKLLDMGSDITLKARQGKIDPIIGREQEIERIIEILCRKTKNNPILIGEAGVGKTAVVEGLAQKIASGNVPEILKDKIVYSLEVGGLMAGTKYRGSMEEKLKDVIDTIIASQNIIVFIDEIHTIAQAGAKEGEVSPSDMLKPYLSRGELQTIGATTTDEYRKYIEPDKALERRFQPIMVNPPTTEQTIEILKGLRDNYESFHKVKITDSAIEAAANLSERYITDRCLPDKAIDLIDEAAARARVACTVKPNELIDKEAYLNKLIANKNEYSIARNYDAVARINEQIVGLSEEVNNLREKFDQNKNRCIVFNDIAEIVSKWTGVPVTKLTESEKEKLINLEHILHKRVVGQDEAISSVCKAIRRSRVGMSDANKPIGSFLFMGQTGVGKTELTKAIAEAMFDDENNIIRLDMSEYMEPHTVSKLIGAPPGYVGYDEGGQLTEAVRRKPYSVVLFDEIEKAHPDIFNTLLQVLDDGRLTDGQGRVVNFRNTIIIMTSNLGSQQAMQNLEDDDNPMVAKQIYLEALRKHFRPEFINRIDVVCIFHPLTIQDLTKIATIMVANINKRLNRQELNLKLTENALDYIIDNGVDTRYGARPLKRFINQEVEDKIAEKILLGELEKSGTIIIDVDGNGLTFENC
ncbi:MAG: ATP-dependent Clp protease ATP-binding subunit [Clostridiales bacterium]|nr:ATP-dependent Clp protease ATP-binding subunit [Clostridiales bacterium]